MKANNEDFKSIPEYVMKKARIKGAEDIVCSATKSLTRQVRFANNTVTASKVYENVSVDIFLTMKKRVVSSEIYDLVNLDSAINDMISLAKATSENKNFYGLAEGKFKYRKENPDTKIITLTEDRIMDYVDSGIKSALGAGAKRVAGTLYTSSTEHVMATSNGISCAERGADIEISMRTFAEKDASGHGVSCATSLADFDPAAAGKSAGEIAKIGLNPVDGEPGKYTILFGPIAFSNFMDYVGMMASAFYVDSGLSFFKDKIGTKVTSDIVSIYDDGTLEKGLNSALSDNEGVPTQKTAIVERGVLKTYLHNTSTAHRYKTVTTGNAGLIAPHPWNIVIEKGDHSTGELIEEVKDGLYITNVWYTRFQNYSAGDFSTIPRDAIFRIKNGKIAGAVKNLRVSDNMLRIMKSISAIGKEQPQIHWWEVGTPVFMPPVIVKDVNVTKSTQ